MKLLNIFTDIFVALYLWDLSDGSVSILCKYYMIFVLGVYSTMLIMGPLFSTRRVRKIILILGKILQLSYLVMVYMFGSSCVNHVISISAMHGVSSGMYYCIYNIYEAEGIANEARTHVIGKYGAIEGVISIVFPIVAGIVIGTYGMNAGLIAAIVITVISMLFAIIYKDDGVSIGHKFSVKEMFKAASNTRNGKDRVKAAFECDLCRGLINSYGSFDLFIQVWTMIAFTTASSVGSVSGFSTAFKILFSLVFAKWGSRLHKKNMAVYYLLRTAVVFSLISMGLTGSILGLLVMTLTLKCSGAIESPIYGCGNATASNSGNLSNYKSEYYITLETGLTISRLTGYGMLWLWGCFNNGIMLAVCIVVYSLVLLITPAVEDKLYRLTYDVG